MAQAKNMLLTNVYLWYCCEENLADFDYYTAKINEIIEAPDTPFVFVIGDFNADTQSLQKCGSELITFCRDEVLLISDLEHVANTDNAY